MNTKAIYTVHENGKEHYFFSEHAGGFSYPFAVADFLHSLKGVLNGSDVTTKRIHGAAVKCRRVSVRPAPDGMAYLTVLGPLPEVA